MSLSADELIGRAQRLARTDDLGGRRWEPGLRALVDALSSEARLLPGRTEATAAEIVDHLVTRARTARLLAERPEILEVPLPAPVFITGLPRSGTTLLHNLMAQLPGWRAWRLWELRSPAVPTGAPADWPRRQLQQSRAMVDALYTANPRFRDIHPVAADAPDECNWALRRSFHTPVWGWSFRAPSYLQWLWQADARPAYLDYRADLQILRWQRPGGVMVLKDPGHLWAPEALLHAFPDARIVRLRRDLDACLPSLASLCRSLWAMGSEPVRPQEVGRAVIGMVEVAHARERAARLQAPGQFIDLDYRDLVADPVGAACSLAAALGAPAGEQGAAQARAWMERQQRGSGHRYSAAEFGIQPAEITRLRAAEA